MPQETLTIDEQETVTIDLDALLEEPATYQELGELMNVILYSTTLSDARARMREHDSFRHVESTLLTLLSMREQAGSPERALLQHDRDRVRNILTIVKQCATGQHWTRDRMARIFGPDLSEV